MEELCVSIKNHPALLRAIGRLNIYLRDRFPCTPVEAMDSKETQVLISSLR